jgi:hypothetical protein
LPLRAACGRRHHKIRSIAACKEGNVDQSNTPEGQGDPQRWRARAALLQIVADARQAHFATDAAMLIAHDADPTLWVRDGEIRPMTRAESLARFAEDFRGATYQEWDYMETPIVRLSDDASLGWVISRVKVRRTTTLADGRVEELRFVYAGIDAYEMRAGAWVRTANASTFAEG